MLKRGGSTNSCSSSLSKREEMWGRRTSRVGVGSYGWYKINDQHIHFYTKADGSIGSSDIILEARSSVHKTTCFRNSHIRNSQIRIHTLINKDKTHLKTYLLLKQHICRICPNFPTAVQNTFWIVHFDSSLNCFVAFCLIASASENYSPINDVFSRRNRKKSTGEWSGWMFQRDNTVLGEIL